MAAAQPNKLESWALAPFLTSKLRVYSEIAASPTSIDHRSVTGCSKAGKEPAEKAESSLIFTREEGASWSHYYAENPTVPQEAISDHSTGS